LRAIERAFPTALFGRLFAQSSRHWRFAGVEMSSSDVLLEKAGYISARIAPSLIRSFTRAISGNSAEARGLEIGVGS
jgi:hypothetical protein